jgi:hypothetical protein
MNWRGLQKPRAPLGSRGCLETLANDSDGSNGKLGSGRGLACKGLSGYFKVGYGQVGNFRRMKSRRSLLDLRKPQGGTNGDQG